MNLSIGCRNRQVGKNWLAIDIIKPVWSGKFPDRFILADAHHLPFSNNYFDCVMASHVFEHFSRINEDRLAVMRIIVPNTARYCCLYAEKKWNMTRLSDMMFGMQTHKGEIHYAGYDSDSLVELFVKNLGKGCILQSLAYGRRGRFPIPDLEIRATFQRIY